MMVIAKSITPTGELLEPAPRMHAEKSQKTVTDTDSSAPSIASMSPTLKSINKLQKNHTNPKSRNNNSPLNS